MSGAMSIDMLMLIVPANVNLIFSISVSTLNIMVYKSRLQWRKLPTEVFACKNKSSKLEKGMEEEEERDPKDQMHQKDVFSKPGISQCYHRAAQHWRGRDTRRRKTRRSRGKRILLQKQLLLRGAIAQHQCRRNTAVHHLDHPYIGESIQDSEKGQAPCGLNGLRFTLGCSLLGLAVGIARCPKKRLAGRLWIKGVSQSRLC